ncbi:MAG: hypothetical protein P1P80_06525 [ANME-2 cluster archaeon]|nr:hypothetical protein [ANME-2 cluster archaeon]
MKLVVEESTLKVIKKVLKRVRENCIVDRVLPQLLFSEALKRLFILNTG